MNKADRIRAVAPGLSDEEIARLARGTVAEVNSLVRVLRQARRDALKDAADKRRQRRRENAAYHNYDEEQLAERNVRVMRKQGERARDGSLDALTALGEMTRHLEAFTALAVDGCRARGYPDPVIAEALGITRQAVGQRFGRKKNALPA
jgi:hypothetical protein